MLFDTNFLNNIFDLFNEEDIPYFSIHSVSTDSRDCHDHSLFVPIIGENFNGHDFLLQAIENGAVASLWQHSLPLPEGIPEDFMIYTVDNTTKALQKLANHYRRYINPKVIAVTGSNGKTTTKDLLASIFKATYKTHATKGNFNNEIGLPLTILSMPRNTDILIVEMGMDKFGEIALLSKIAEPNIAMITNIGESHIEYLGSRKGIATAKLEIIESLNQQGTLIVDGDEPLLNKDFKNFNKLTCGFNEKNDYHISHVSMKNFTTQFTINDNKDFIIPLLGDHHAKNAAFAFAVAEQFGINEQIVNQAFQSLEHSSMRFQAVKGKNDVTIINDAYNASATSMKAAINVVKKMTPFKCKILVLGDILELGDYAEQLHLSVAEEITAPINVVLTVGDEASVISEYVTSYQPTIKSMHFQNKEMVIQELKKYFNDDTIILFKASRGLAFEEIVDQCLVNNK